MQDGRDVWWHDDGAAASRPSARPRRWTARTCCTSSTRRARPGKPKGIMHTTGGYLTQVAYTHKYVFDLQARHRRLLVHRRRRLGHRPLVHRLRPAREPRDVGALRGHARLPRQGPLLVDRREVQGHDLLHRADRDPNVHEVGRRVSPQRHDLSSLRLIGTVGEPINPEAWVWYYKVIGGERCPVVDTWWQTETGAIMISALPGATTLKPGSATFPLPGIEAGHRRRRRQAGRHSRRRLPRARTAVAVDAARHLGRSASATATRTGRASTASTSRATAPSATTRATSGCSAASTTSCSCRATTSRRPRSSPRSSTIPRLPKPPSSARSTTRPGRRSPRS